MTNANTWPVRVEVGPLEGDLINRLSVTGTVMNFSFCLVPEGLWHTLRKVAVSTNEHQRSVTAARSLVRKIDRKLNGPSMFEVLAEIEVTA